MDMSDFLVTDFKTTQPDRLLKPVRFVGKADLLFLLFFLG
jgi:hypothetical protein